MANIPYGTGANQAVRLNGSAQLPAVDGTQLTGVIKAPVAPYIVTGGVAVDERQGLADELTGTSLDAIWTPYGVGGNRTITPTVNGVVLADTVGDNTVWGADATLPNMGMRRIQFKMALKYATFGNTTNTYFHIEGTGGKIIDLYHYYTGGGWNAKWSDSGGNRVTVGGLSEEINVCGMLDPVSGAARMSYRTIAYDSDSGWPGEVAGWTPIGSFFVVAVGNLLVAPTVGFRALASTAQSVTVRGFKVRYLG